MPPRTGATLIDQHEYGIRRNPLKRIGKPSEAKLSIPSTNSDPARVREHIKKLRPSVGEHAGIIDLHHTRMRWQFKRGAPRKTRFDTSIARHPDGREAAGRPASVLQKTRKQRLQRGLFGFCG